MIGERYTTYFQETDFDATISRLTSLLQEHRPILMVGAGSSTIVGYPGWSKLVDELGKLTPQISRINNEDDLDYAGRIKNQLDGEGRIKEYFDFLESTFRPKQKQFTQFHTSLLNLGFAGIVTTNYDIVLELAIHQVYGNWYKSIDLCSSEKKYDVFGFLRSISNKKIINSVLHLHGCFENSKNIILTQNDYLKAYGETNLDGEKMEHGQILHTFHRKVIWSLQASHPLVFVGFSMKDKFFMKMLEIVMQDFKLDSEPMHYAIISDKEKETLRSLELNGIYPLFYPHSEDHIYLQKLISEVENSLNKISTADDSNRDLHKYKSLTEDDTVLKGPIVEESMIIASDQPNNIVSQTESLNLEEINRKMLEL